VERPPVSVIVPFVGSEPELADVCARFAAALGSADELLVGYNAPSAVASRDGVSLVWDGPRGSPGSARNAAAAQAGGEWLVFADADCDPEPRWLERWFDPIPGERVGVLAGGVRDEASGNGVAAEVARSTGALDQRATLRNAFLPYGVTANLAVRAVAFREVAGFETERRIAEDADLCWRLQRAGWALDERPQARVAHRSRETLVALWRQRAQNGAAARWLAARYPGAMPKWNLLALCRDSARRMADGARRGPDGALLEAAVVSGWWAFELGRRAPGWMARR
jgi:cellulose synthase/poly-beta-1,6-N-acetylglucosamine synthase-like glycosyltransferase